MPTAESSELKYWVGLSMVRGLGPKNFAKLYGRYGSAKKIWNLSRRDLISSGISQHIADSLEATRSKVCLEKEMERIQKLNISVIRLVDENYPYRLKNIPSPPFLLYVKGELCEQDSLAVSVVGTRKCTNYGVRATKYLVSSLSEGGFTVVSGLAYGIDSVAHRTALKCSGRTIAVLGCGVDQVYPAGNRELAHQIIGGATGAIISEFPLGFPPTAGNFPARNRIISGLSLAVLVTEAPKRSGALLTASCAAEQGRPVYAVPGSLFSSNSEGANRLISDGAAPVVDCETLLSDLGASMKKKQIKARKELPQGEREKTVFGVMSEDPKHVDKIVRASELPTSVVLSTLSKMELRGMVVDCGGGKWAKKV
ncbi:MAG: DNA-processing protein DprA [Patescibacteria group bacterium]|nr:DNA-processing protein DprA [Patescibacteria group bacterium]